MATIKTTDENFDQVVLKSEKPFVQRFTAEWCGPCKMIAPLLEELSDELKDKVLFGVITLMMNQTLQQNLEYAVFQLCCCLKVAK
jgi:thioredoxin 1